MSFDGGVIHAHWYRKGEAVVYEVDVVGSSAVYYNGQRLKEGKNVFYIEKENVNI